MVCAWLFAISGFSQAQTITVTSPNRGEVNILLFSGAQRVGTIQNNVPVAAVSFSWVVGNYQGGTAAPGTNYKIKVRKPGTQIMDDSDRRFTISAVPLSASLTVTSPNGGETWRTEAAHQIRWTSSGVPGDVTIRLKKGGSVITSRAAENIGIAYWFCSGVQAATDHKIRVENSTGSVFDESDHNFTIQALSVGLRPGLSIQVESSGGGETWRLMALGNTARSSFSNFLQGGSSVKAGRLLRSTFAARQGPIISAGCPRWEAGTSALKSASGRVREVRQSFFISMGS